VRTREPEHGLWDDRRADAVTYVVVLLNRQLDSHLLFLLVFHLLLIVLNEQIVEEFSLSAENEILRACHTTQ
jgi:hypothetical protein